MKNIVQIAGIIDEKEAALLIECGVDWLGFPLRLPVHKEDVSEAEAAKIIRSLQPPHKGTLITYLHDADEVVSFCNYLGVHNIQLHGDIDVGEARRIKKLDSGLFVIKSLVVRKDNMRELEKMVRNFGPVVDAFITDTYDSATGASGATGKIHDWNVSKRLIELSPLPVILAGGLTPENVARAIIEVEPAGVDAHTRVEGQDGRKDAALVRAFVAEARAAFSGIKAT